MRLISHRGNLTGPNFTDENKPWYIEEAVKAGFNVEVDIWYVKGKWFTGHDEPLHEVTIEWLSNKNFWLHCKNVEAFEQMTYISPQLHYFWHGIDCYTLTSANIPWVYPGKQTFKTAICVLPEHGEGLDKIRNLDVYGFCSDYIEKIAEIVKCK
jgi:hypothetical protein